MEQFLFSILSAVENWFEVQIPFKYTKITQEVLDELLVLTMEGGTFGFYGEDSGTMMLGTSEGGKIRLILRRIFPSVKSISDRYTYLKESPWLLPVAWWHRLLLNKGSIKEERKLLGEIANSDMKYVKQIKDLYRKIGL